MRNAPSVANVLCTADVKNSSREHNLQAVQCDDGMLRIYLDGRALDDSVWPEQNVDSCIDAFLAKRLELLRGERRV